MSVLSHSSSKILAAVSSSPLPWFVSLRYKITKPRLPKELFVERAEEHERFGGDPNQPHKLHIVTRVRSVVKRPYWEKDMIKCLGLTKAQVPVIHKNIPSVNKRLAVVKHLVRIQPLKTPYGLPAEEDMADTYINSQGELIIHRLLQPVELKAIES